MKQEEEILDDDVKQAMDAKEKADAQSESTDKDQQGDKSSEDVKSDTTQKKPDPVPYERFKEVNEKAKKAEEFESFISQHGDKVRRNPQSGKLEFVIENKQPDKTSSDPFELSEDEMLAFDEDQLKVIDKLLAKRERELMGRAEMARTHQEQSDSWWNKTKEKFPDVKNTTSDLYQRADKILKASYVQWGPDGKSFYIPPNAHYLATRDAFDELEAENKSQSEAESEEKKIHKQNNFVEKKSAKEPPKGKHSDKDVSKMSETELNDALEAEFKERNPD